MVVGLPATTCALAAVESPDHVRVGSFVLRHNPGWESPFVNYAIPDDGAAPSVEDVEALVAAFRQRNRVPRLEYLWARPRGRSRPARRRFHRGEPGAGHGLDAESLAPRTLRPAR